MALQGGGEGGETAVRNRNKQRTSAGRIGISCREPVGTGHYLFLIDEIICIKIFDNCRGCQENEL
jgi:hypothetical protein